MTHKIFTLVLIILISLFKTSAQDTIIPLQLEVTPTIRCIGLHWTVKGDLNGNATGSVEFRKQGTTQWHKAIDMFRWIPRVVTSKSIGGVTAIDEFNDVAYNVYKMNYLASSIFHLSPGTTYEIRVAIKDPDGGGTSRVVTSTTRVIPEIHLKRGNKIAIKDDNALLDAVSCASPGDILVLHAGTYNGFSISRDGNASNPICITTEGSGDVIFTSNINIEGDYIYIKGINMDGCGFRPKGCKNLAIMNCNISNVFTAISGPSDSAYIADNTLSGKYLSTGGNEGTGIEVSGTGNVYCYNSITQFSDAMSPGCVGEDYPGGNNFDIYGNDVIRCGTDAVEFDVAAPTNCRVWGNRFSFTMANEISFQYFYGGPAYVIKNCMFNIAENTIKDRQLSAGLVLINNTMVTHSAAWNKGTDFIQHIFARNNLFYDLSGGTVVFYRCEDFLRDPFTIDLDYNAYNGRIQGENWDSDKWSSEEAAILVDHSPKTLAEFKNMFGMEKHGVLVANNDCFDAPFPKNLPFGDIWNTNFSAPHPDLQLKSSSPLIDAGIAIPNIIGGYNGVAPDIGALEYGTKVQWGPRASDWVYPFSEGGI
ncbi:MAG: chondroitinase-B domain-containing protein [Bacteroidales bacterium]